MVVGGGSLWELWRTHSLGAVNGNSQWADGMTKSRCVDDKDGLLKFKLGAIMSKTDKLSVKFIKFVQIYDACVCKISWEGLGEHKNQLKMNK